MTCFVQQRTGNDCSIAAIAMATGRPYDEVLAAALKRDAYVEGQGTKAEQWILEELGYSYAFENGECVGDFLCRRRGFDLSTESFRNIGWGRRAIFGVPSLNIIGGHHSVFWDGHAVHDPNPPELKRYSRFDEIHPDDVILFREHSK